MKPKDILGILSKLGIELSGPALAAIALAVPLLIAGAVWLYKHLKKRSAEKRAAGPDVQKAPGQSSEPDIAPTRLVEAWLRFLSRLPARYQRSILAFDHFILLGTGSSERGKLVDAQTDWRHQMKQIAGDAPIDPALPVYLASGAVITELPQQYLEDSSERCRKALDRLWRPLYRRKTPTVVVTIDAPWLMESTPDVLADLARSFRAKVNQLSAIRGRPVEVRVAVTRLGSIVGFGVAAAHWVKEGISARVPLAASGAVRPSLDDWQAESRAHIPRALAALGSSEYRKFIAFLRAVPGLLAPLDHFLEALFAVDAMAESPGRGGVYLCSEVQGATSPLRHGVPSKGPDPRRRHLIIAAAAASACVTYLGIAYHAQYSVWSPAADALRDYRIPPALVTAPRLDGADSIAGQELESEQRRKICEFTVEQTGFLYRFPGFFDRSRDRMKDELSKQLRSDLLLERLRSVAKSGILGPNNMTLRWRRTLYYLGLVHSYDADRLEIHRHLDAWTAMTGLPKDIIEDYLANTRAPYVTPETSKLSYGQTDLRETDQRDTALYWSRLPRGMAKAMADGALRPEELAAMKELATEMSQSLPRFEDDELTLSILDRIDSAAYVPGAGGPATGPGLHDAYYPTFVMIINNLKRADIQRQVGSLNLLIEIVKKATIWLEPPSGLLPDLTDRLSLLQTRTPVRVTPEPIRLDLAGETFTIDEGQWNDVLQSSRARLLIDQFSGLAGSGSIFFSPQIDAELRPVVWNALSTDDSSFRGKATLSGRYTRAAFERRVQAEVLRLVEVLGKVKLPDEQERRLLELVREEVRRYSVAYRNEILRFLRSYEVNAPSIEALRVLLGQVASERSLFDDFLSALDENTHIETQGAPAKDDGTGKKDKKGTAKKGEEPKKGEDAAEAEGAAQREARVAYMLEPIHEALRDFDAWHDAVGSGAPKLVEYKQISAQLLTDLTAAQAEPPAAGDAGSALEKELSPAGRAVLASLRGDKGSYDALVRVWIADTKLPAAQQAPFLAPFSRLARLGEIDVETVVARVWNREMWPPVKEISTKFPFDRAAERSALPEELTALLHPTDGKLFSLFRAYFEPISAFGDGQPFRERPSARGRVRVPPELYPTMNAAAALASRLWDPKGAPRKLEARVATVPFSTSRGAKLAPTAVYLNVGETSVFNFNQKPSQTTVGFDWTRDESASIGVQVTDVDTKETGSPTPLAPQGAYWRFLRLLLTGKATAVTRSVDSTMYEWSLPLEDGGSEKMTARFVVVGDPWRSLSLPRGAAGRAAR